MLKIHVEYWYYKRVSETIHRNFPGKFEVTGNEARPRSGAFELTYLKDGVEKAVLFSKLDLNRFPSEEETVNAINQYEETGTVPQLEPSGWCSIL